jgi:hypothetical protein
MPKIPITFSDELYDALHAEAERRNTTIAALVREYSTQALAKQGITVTERVQWGGSRRKPKQKTDKS